MSVVFKAQYGGQGPLKYIYRPAFRVKSEISGIGGRINIEKDEQTAAVSEQEPCLAGVSAL